MDMSVMDMSDMGGDDSMSGTLSAAGVDLNQTQAADFLDDILDDTVFQVTGNQYARYFWYGVVVVIGIAGLLNIAQKATLEMRCADRFHRRHSNSLTSSSELDMLPQAEYDRQNRIIHS